MNFKELTLSDVSLETKVETLGIVLDKKLEELYNTVSTVESVVGPQGEKGDKGDKGDPGRDGRDGLDGLNGKDGRDGKDGLDGESGLGVADVEVDLDGRLLVTLTDGSIRKTAKEVVGPQGPRGVPGADGKGGTGTGLTGNLDGGLANSNYGGITAIDAGYA